MTEQSMVLLVQVVLDVGDIARAVTFWGALLAQECGAARASGKLVSVGVLAGTTCRVLHQVPEGKTGKNRVYLGFAGGDVDAAVKRIRALGCSKVREVREGGGHFVTRADPDGNEF